MADELQQLHRDARTIFDHSVNQVLPEHCIPELLKRRGNQLIVNDRRYDLSAHQNIYLIAFGKAATGMYGAVADILSHDLTRGIVISNHISEQFRQEYHEKVSAYQGTHPLPTQDNIRATEQVIDLCENASPEDLVIFCISGGGSALLYSPKEEVPFDEYRELVDALLKRGATISELNNVRIALSRVKGGQLLSYLRGSTVLNLIISDVIGDLPEFIASGPTVPPSTELLTQGYTLATSVLEKYELYRKYHHWLTPLFRRDVFPEPELEPNTYIVGSNRMALLAAGEQATNLGYTPVVLSTRLEGESREIGHLLGTILLEIYESGNPLRPPCCLLSGGETTVSVTGSGKGGRNMELALGAADILRETDLALLLSAGTDGIDGPTDTAGAIVDSTTAFRAVHEEVSIVDALHNNDSYHFFQSLGDLVKSGPTGTNVMDVQIGLMR